MIGSPLKSMFRSEDRCLRTRLFESRRPKSYPVAGFTTPTNIYTCTLTSMVGCSQCLLRHYHTIITYFQGHWRNIAWGYSTIVSPLSCHVCLQLSSLHTAPSRSTMEIGRPRGKVPACCLILNYLTTESRVLGPQAA